MSYDPTNWQTGDIITAEKLNKIEQALVDLYEQIEGGDIPAGYVVVAPEQSVTSTDIPAELTLDSGYTLPETLPEDWLVSVDGNTLEYEDGTMIGVAMYYYMTTDTIYQVAIYNGSLILAVQDIDQGTIVPGTYTVSIYEPEESGGVEQ